MKNKENTRTKKQPAPARKTAGSELHSDSTIITKLGGIKVKLTPKMIRDIFTLILNAQEDIDEMLKNGGGKIDLLFDDQKFSSTKNTKSEVPILEESRQELIIVILAHFKMVLNNFSDFELIKLSDIIIEKQRQQKQLIN